MTEKIILNVTEEAAVLKVKIDEKRKQSMKDLIGATKEAIVLALANGHNRFSLRDSMFPYEITDQDLLNTIELDDPEYMIIADLIGRHYFKIVKKSEHEANRLAYEAAKIREAKWTFKFMEMLKEGHPGVIMPLFFVITGIAMVLITILH